MLKFKNQFVDQNYVQTDYYLEIRYYLSTFLIHNKKLAICHFRFFGQ